MIFGIREEHGMARELSPVEFSEAKEQQFRNWAHSKAVPSPDLEMVRVSMPNDPNRGCLIIVVAKSARAPHAVQRDREAGLRYVVRVGRDTRALMESEVAERYGQRFQHIDARVDRLEIFGTSTTNLRLVNNYSWVTLALVPENPGHFEVSKETLAETQERAQYGLDQSRGLFKFSQPDVRAGLRHIRATVLDADGRPIETYFEFHTDGAAFGGRQLFMPEGRERIAVRNEVRPTVVGAALCIQLAQCLRRLGDHAVAAGCSGVAFARASILAPAHTRLGFSTGHEVAFYHPSDPIPLGFTPPPISIVLEEALASPQAWISTTRLLLLDLFNACGLPNVNPINPDGSLNTSDDTQQSSGFLTWADVRDLPRRPA